MCLPVLHHVGVVGFNATFNNVSVILWRSVLLVEETGENTTDLPQVTDKLYHIILYTSPLRGIRTHNISGERHRLNRQTAPYSPMHTSFVYLYIIYFTLNLKCIPNIVIFCIQLFLSLQIISQNYIPPFSTNDGMRYKLF